ncbi:MAG TPA: hypothetical protein ACFYD5_04950 [Candidatus Tripitaka sp. YC43]
MPIKRLQSGIRPFASLEGRPKQTPPEDGSRSRREFLKARAVAPPPLRHIKRFEGDRYIYAPYHKIVLLGVDSHGL